MDRLWGEFRPVPAAALDRAEGRRAHRPPAAASSRWPTRRATRRTTSATSTRDTGIAFVGDTAGIRISRAATSCRRRRRPTSTSRPGARASAASSQWRPDTAVPHALRPARAGRRAPHRDGRDHLELDGEPRQGVAARDRATTRIASSGSPRSCGGNCGGGMSEADAHAYEVAGRFDLNWRGLARYWRKRN